MVAKMSPVTLEVAYPERSSRLLLFFKGLLIIPHIVVLALYGVAIWVVLFIAWLAILFTGRFPRGLFNEVVGYLRWQTRVNAYMMLLRDEYPPFGGK